MESLFQELLGVARDDPINNHILIRSEKGDQFPSAPQNSSTDLAEETITPKDNEAPDGFDTVENHEFPLKSSITNIQDLEQSPRADDYCKDVVETVDFSGGTCEKDLEEVAGFREVKDDDKGLTVLVPEQGKAATTLNRSRGKSDKERKIIWSSNHGNRTMRSKRK